MKSRLERCASQGGVMDKIVYHRDGREKTIDVHDASRLVGTGQAGANKDWSFVKPPPLNWEFETPKYLATRDLQPAQRSRFRFEPPFSTIWDSDEWQYGAQPVKAGEEFETREWPHPSFRAVNFSAGKVLDFFNSRMKSRLPLSPWHGDRIRLDDGLTGPTQPNISINSGVTAA
jgi:hypothetical protein